MNSALDNDSDTLTSSIFSDDRAHSASGPRLACHKCAKTASSGSTLKICSGCKDTRYCSRECQKADWKAHKKACKTKNMASGAESCTVESKWFNEAAGDAHDDEWEDIDDLDSDMPSIRRAGLGVPTVLHWHGLSETTAFSHIIDAYRLRVEDEYKYSANTRGLYNQESPLPDFRRFLNKAEKRPGLLPSWWSKEKGRECEAFGRNPRVWSELNSAVEAHDIVEHYGDPTLPAFLRLFAEKVERKSAMGMW